jgi:hypothetical protein
VVPARFRSNGMPAPHSEHCYASVAARHLRHTVAPVRELVKTEFYGEIGFRWPNVVIPHVLTRWSILTPQPRDHENAIRTRKIIIALWPFDHTRTGGDKHDRP